MSHHSRVHVENQEHICITSTETYNQWDLHDAFQINIPQIVYSYHEKPHIRVNAIYLVLLSLVHNHTTNRTRKCGKKVLPNNPKNLIQYTLSATCSKLTDLTTEIVLKGVLACKSIWIHFWQNYWWSLSLNHTPLSSSREYFTAQSHWKSG